MGWAEPAATPGPASAPRSPGSAAGEAPRPRASALCGLCSVPQDPAIGGTQKGSAGDQWQEQGTSTGPWSRAPLGMHSHGPRTHAQPIPDTCTPGHAHPGHAHPRSRGTSTPGPGHTQLLDTHTWWPQTPPPIGDPQLGDMDALTHGPRTPLGHGRTRGDRRAAQRDTRDTHPLVQSFQLY